MEINTRSQALEAGETKYFTGKPCKHGHVAERWTRSGACCDCMMEIKKSDGYKKFDEAYRNSDHRKAYLREYRKREVVVASEAFRKMTEKYRSLRRARGAKRRSAEKQRIPPWFGELDTLVWLEAMDLAIAREKATKIKWSADHMIPIQADSASGLHVWNNCQVIPALANSWKRNKLILTESGEWITALL